MSRSGSRAGDIKNRVSLGSKLQYEHFKSALKCNVLQVFKLGSVCILVKAMQTPSPFFLCLFYKRSQPCRS